MTAASDGSSGLLAVLGPQRGTVVSFDEEVGLGTIEDAGGASSRYRFHCTQITDGTRRIPVGAAVTFSVVAGRRGAWEAASVTPLGET